MDKLSDEYKDKAGFYYADVEDGGINTGSACLLYTSPSPRDLSTSRMPSSAWKKIWNCIVDFKTLIYRKDLCL